MTPRTYQAHAIRANVRLFKQYDSLLTVMATGTGKTIVFAHVLQEMISEGGRAIVVAHREELITQARAKIASVCNISADVEMAEYRADMFHQWKSPVVVASIDTLISRRGAKRRMHKFDPSEFKLLIIDEAHHATAAKYRLVIDYFRAGGTKLMGVTATPDRKDGAALGALFDRVAETEHGCAYRYEIDQAIREGWLVPIVPTRTRVTGLDFSRCRTTAGELNGRDLARTLEAEEPLHEMVSSMVQIAGQRKTLVFAATLWQADRMAEILNRHQSDCARFVHGKTPKDERRQMFRDYRKDRFQYLVNVGVTTEGFDEPAIAVVAMCRPTKSRALYCQMAGRGTRPLEGIVDVFSEDPDTQHRLGFEGLTDPVEIRKRRIAESAKPNLEIIDFVGNAGRHYLISAFDVLSGTYGEAVVNRARRMSRNAREGDNADLIERLEAAKRAEEAEQKRRAARRSIVGRSTYTTEYIDPFALFKVAPETQTNGVRDKPASSAQLNLLKRFGIAPRTLRDMSSKNASLLIGRLIVRNKRKFCSPKVAVILRRHGFSSDMAAVRAKPIMEVLRTNGWRWPDHLPRPNADGTPAKASDKPRNEQAPWPW